MKLQNGIKRYCMYLFKFPTEQEEKFNVLKQRIESLFSTRSYEKPKISSEQLKILGILSNYSQVYFYTKTPIFEDPDQKNFLSCKTFKLDSIEKEMYKNKGKVFVFYYCIGEIIQGLFIRSSEWTNINREKSIDSILD